MSGAVEQMLSVDLVSSSLRSCILHQTFCKHVLAPSLIPPSTFFFFCKVKIVRCKRQGSCYVHNTLGTANYHSLIRKAVTSSLTVSPLTGSVLV